MECIMAGGPGGCLGPHRCPKAEPKVMTMKIPSQLLWCTFFSVQPGHAFFLFLFFFFFFFPLLNWKIKTFYFLWVEKFEKQNSSVKIRTVGKYVNVFESAIPMKYDGRKKLQSWIKGTLVLNFSNLNSLPPSPFIVEKTTRELHRASLHY